MSLVLSQNARTECSLLDESAIQKIINESRIHYQIPALSVSISCSGEQGSHDFVSGTLTREGDTPIHANTLFQVGSITKSFVAVVLLQLEAEKILSLDDPIRKWLAKLPLSWQNITIRQLLNHSSGIYNYTDTFDEIMRTTRDLDFYKRWHSEALINLAVDKPLYFEPGQGWHYSNTNYALAGMIIEAATGRSLKQELEERIFSPLNMKHSYYLPEFSQDFLETMAHGYSVREYFPDEPKDVTDYDLSWSNAGGGIISTSHDLSLWLRALMKGLLLPQRQMEALLTTIPINSATPIATQEAGYGLGLVHDLTSLGEESWWHSGGMLGYSSYMAWLKDKDTIIVVTMSHISKKRDMYEITKLLAEYFRKL